MKKFLIRAAAMLLVLTALAASLGTVAFADGTITVDVPVQFRQSEARNMLGQVNQLRQPGSAWYWNEDGSRNEPAGLQPLNYDYGLEQIAMQRAAEIVLRFSHTRPNGNICFSASAGGATTWGENIAYNYDAASSGAFDQWQEADDGYEGQGHRRNMLSGDFTAIGIACACYQGVYFWVQEFGYPSGAGDPGANNGDTAVPVEVRPDGAPVTARLQGESAVTMTYGSTAAAPGVFLTVELGGLSFSSSQPAAADWTAEDGSVVSVSDGTLTALKAGSTALVCQAYGLRVDVTVAPLSLDGADVVLPSPLSYSGAPLTPEPEVTLNGRQLTRGKDYEVSYRDHVEPGTAVVEISGKGNYTGTVRSGFEIVDCEHVWDGEYVTEKEPSCLEAGTEKRTCTVCGFVDSRPVKPLPHSPEEVPETAPSCTEEGTAAGTRCSVCDAVLSGTEPIPALGHSWDPDSVEVLEDSSCTREGTASHRCQVCGAEETYALPLKAHTPALDPIMAASCTREGKTSGSHCAVCGAVIDAQETVPAQGHWWMPDSEKILSPATCDREGLASHECGKCGTVETYAVARKGHSFSAWRVTVPAGKSTEGQEERVCSVCGAVETQTIPAKSASVKSASGEASPSQDKDTQTQSKSARSAAGLSAGSQGTDLGAHVPADKTTGKTANTGASAVRLLLPGFLLVLVSATSAAVFLKAKKHR